MKYTIALTMTTAAIAIAVPRPVQRPDVPAEVGPITGTDENVADPSAIAIPRPIKRPHIPGDVGRIMDNEVTPTSLAIAIPGPIQRPDVPVEIGPITGTDGEIAASSAIAIPGLIQSPDLPIDVGPIIGTDGEVNPSVSARSIQSIEEDWYAALRDPAPTPLLTRRGCRRKHRGGGDDDDDEVGELDRAWLDQLIDNVEVDTEEEQAEGDRRMREMLEGQRPADQTMEEFSEDLKLDLHQYDAELEAEIEEEERKAKEKNEKWHKRRGKILKRKRRLWKILDFLDRALTWIWGVKADA